MGKTLAALLRLQSIELQLAEVRNRLRVQSAAVDAQKSRIEQLQEDYQRLHHEALTRQKEVANYELELRGKEEAINKLRTSLNTAKTNKEYAAILTQINTLKADNSKLEDRALGMLQEVDQVRSKSEQVKQQVGENQQRLEQIQHDSAEEIARLKGMLEDFETRRAEAASQVPSEVLAIFERIAATRDGEAMASIETHGKKPPHDYSCGGCYMSIAAENANALRTRDELRFCDNCGRILYLEEHASAQKA